MDKVEKDFTAFAKQRAEQLAPGLEWSEPKPEDLANGEDAWMSDHPKSLWSLTHYTRKLLAEQRWAVAKKEAQRLVDLYPDHTGPDSGYLLLAEAERGLKETDQERAALNKLAVIDGSALEAYQRLMELDSATNEWSGVVRNAERFLEVNPLVPQPYRYLARASEELGHLPEAIGAYETLLLLDPPDPADLHYQLAKLLYKQGDASAKRQVLEALEDAPRFRDAHRLLLQIVGNQATDGSSKTEPDAPSPSPPAQRDGTR
jgi:tetratricopeptide (TPR) repeat protein